MSYSGTFTKISTAASQTITGVGFQSAAIIFWTSGATALATWQPSFRQMIGFWCPSGGYSVCGSSEDNVATSNTARRFSDQPVSICTPSNTLESEASLAITADGFTLTWGTNTASTDYIIHFLALTGYEVLQSTVANWTMATVGNSAVTGVGFAPNFILHIHAGGTTAALPTNSTSAAIGFGVTGPNAAAGNVATPGQWAWGMFDQDAQGNKPAFSNFSQPGGGINQGCILLMNNLGITSALGGFHSYDSDGFTIEYTTNPSSGFRVLSLCLSVVSGNVGLFAKPTGAAPATQTLATSITPGALFLASGQKTNIEGTAGVRLGISAQSRFNTSATAIQEQRSAGALTSQCNCYDSADGFDLADNDTPVVDAIGTVTVPVSTGFQVIWDPNSANATLFGYATIGAVSPPVSTGGWLIIREPTIGLTDRSSYLYRGEGVQHSFTSQIRQRGQAQIQLQIPAGDSYSPTRGTQLFLYDQTSTANFPLVFSGLIQNIEDQWASAAGVRFIIVTAVSLESIFDTVYATPVQYVNQTAGFIFADLITRFETGAPVTAGTIQPGPVIPLLATDFETISELDDQLATSAQFVWGVDPATLTAFFQSPASLLAPFIIDESKMLWGSGVSPQVGWHQNGADYRNRQAIRLSFDAFDHSKEYFVGAGQTSFTLRRAVNQVTNAWVTLSTQNTATATFTGQPNPGDTITTAPVSAAWQALHVYGIGGIIVVGGFVQKVTTAGTSGAAQPTFSTVTGGTVGDGSMIWTCQGPSGLANGTETYTFVSALDNTEFGQVLIGASAAATAQNLADAINSTQTVAGVTFSLPTWENSLLNARTVTGSAFDVESKSAGSGWVVSLTESATNFAWSAVTTSGGTSPQGSVGPGEPATITIAVYVLGTSTAAPGLAYQTGSDTVTLATPLNAGTNLQVEYTRQGGDVIQCEDTALVMALAVLSGGTGEYQAITNYSSGLIAQSRTTGLQLAQQALAAFSVPPQTVTFTTRLPGLQPGQTLTVAVTKPTGASALLNGSWIVQQIDAEFEPLLLGTWIREPSGAGHYRYTVRAVNIQEVGSWLEFWQGQGGGSLGGGGSGSGSPLVATSGGALAVPGTDVASGTQTANTVYAGPATGAAAAPTFRALVAADLPVVAFGPGAGTYTVGLKLTGGGVNGTITLDAQGRITAIQQAT